MNKEQSNNLFFDNFKNKYPNFKIITFTNLSSPILIEDELGFLHEKNSAFSALKYSYGIQSIIDKEKYIEYRIKENFNNLTLLKYNGMKNPLLVEDENGFKYNPQCYDLIRGSKVTIETCSEKEKLFLFKANKIHNDFYEYDDFKYVNGKTKINIKCPFHGSFQQICESHLRGHGCSKCGSVGFSKESWLKKTKGKTSFFYILRVFNENEEFIKFGITSNTVKERYRRLKNYQYEIVNLIEGTPSKIYDMEKRLIKEYKNYKTLPKLPFEGWTECFSVKCLDKIKNEDNRN